MPDFRRAQLHSASQQPFDSQYSWRRCGSCSTASLNVQRRITFAYLIVRAAARQGAAPWRVRTRRGAAGGSAPLIEAPLYCTANRAAPGGARKREGGARAAAMNRVRLRPCSAARPRYTCLAACLCWLAMPQRAEARVALHPAAVSDRNTVLAGTTGEEVSTHDDESKSPGVTPGLGCRFHRLPTTNVIGRYRISSEDVIAPVATSSVYSPPSHA